MARTVADVMTRDPITVQPDGTPAAYRIAPSQTWTIANTFQF